MTVQIPMQDVFDAYRVLVCTPLGEVAAERAKQDEKWGEQNHPMRPAEMGWLDFYASQAGRFQRDNAKRVEDGTLTWDAILFEEVYEALGAMTPEAMREELVQVAAVAVAMIECIDRAATTAS